MKTFSPSWTTPFAFLYFFNLGFVILFSVLLLHFLVFLFTNSPYSFLVSILFSLLFIGFSIKKIIGMIRNQKLIIKNGVIFFPKPVELFNILLWGSVYPKTVHIADTHIIEISQRLIGNKFMYDSFSFHINKGQSSTNYSGYYLAIPWRRKDIQEIVKFLNQEYPNLQIYFS